MKFYISQFLYVDRIIIILTVITRNQPYREVTIHVSAVAIQYKDSSVNAIVLLY